MRRLSSLRVDVVPSDASRGLLTIALPVWPSLRRCPIGCAPERVSTALTWSKRARLCDAQQNDRLFRCCACAGALLRRFA